MNGSTGWDALLHWSKIVAKTADLDGEERNYKLTIADNLAGVRDQLLSDNQDWTNRLTWALSPSRQNLLNWRFVDEFNHDLEFAPDRVKAALLAVWSGEPSVAQLNAFVQLAAEWPKKHTPGNLLSLGTLLMLALDPHLYPPFRARPVTTWLKLVGRTAPGSGAAPADRYQALLDFLDELIARASAAGLDLSLEPWIDRLGDLDSL